MKYILILLCTILPWSAAQCNKTGKSAPFYSYLVEIYSGEEKICDGTVISDEWILTAAHCLTYQNDSLWTKYGTRENQTVGGSVRLTDKVTHPSYDPIAMSYDVALIKLAEKIDSIESVPLPESGCCIGEGSVATLLGWVADKNEPHKYISSTPILIHDKKPCSTIDIISNIPHDMICGSESNGDNDYSCDHRGGAPLLCGDTQFGIFTATDCVHTLYTPTSECNIRDFIKETANV